MQVLAMIPDFEVKSRLKPPNGRSISQLYLNFVNQAVIIAEARRTLKSELGRFASLARVVKSNNSKYLRNRQFSGIPAAAMFPVRHMDESSFGLAP